MKHRIKPKFAEKHKVRETQSQRKSKSEKIQVGENPSRRKSKLEEKLQVKTTTYFSTTQELEVTMDKESHNSYLKINIADLGRPLCRPVQVCIGLHRSARGLHRSAKRSAWVCTGLQRGRPGSAQVRKRSVQVSKEVCRSTKRSAQST